MGQTITQNSTGSALCTIKALAHIVHDILFGGGTDDTLLCSVGNKGTWTPVEHCHVIDEVRDTAKELNLEKQVIDPDLVGAH